MKGLIFSITAGQGHNQTAKVLSEYFNAIGAQCSYMDVFEYINPLLSESVSKIYLASTKSLPKIYGRIYRMCEKRPGDESYGLQITTQLLAKRLIKMVEKEAPDFIICTHVFAALLVSALSANIDKDIKTIGIVTDFTIHPYWEDTSLDYYITASEVLTNQGVKKGISEGKLKPFGIPIDVKFATKLTREEALEKLGLPDKRTILVMSGSMGFGNMQKEIIALDRLDMDFQVVCICGNNKKLEKSIEKLNTQKSVFTYGYVDNVDVFMDAADCILTKPGGLTTSEALAKGLPMIMSNPVPGQEDRNVEFLLNAGAALKVSRTYPLDDAVVQMFSGGRSLLIQEAMKSLGKPNATRDLAVFVKDIVTGGRRDE